MSRCPDQLVVQSFNNKVWVTWWEATSHQTIAVCLGLTKPCECLQIISSMLHSVIQATDCESSQTWLPSFSFFSLKSNHHDWKFIARGSLQVWQCYSCPPLSLCDCSIKCINASINSATVIKYNCGTCIIKMWLVHEIGGMSLKSPMRYNKIKANIHLMFVSA